MPGVLEVAILIDEVVKLEQNFRVEKSTIWVIYHSFSSLTRDFYFAQLDSPEL